MTSSKYALVERERRFLVPTLPPDEPSARWTITDLYVEGTRIRVRRVEGIVNGQPDLACKLTQKIPDSLGPTGRCGFITNMYLSEEEYARFASLPGARLRKERLSFPPMGVDVFGGPLTGLIVAEAEFADDETMTAFQPPRWCGREITDHPPLTGAKLARIAAMPHDDAKSALAQALAFRGPDNE